MRDNTGHSMSRRFRYFAGRERAHEIVLRLNRAEYYETE
jgi:hypothetical protein